MGEHEDVPRLHPQTGVILAARCPVGRELLDEGAVTRIEAGGDPERQQDVAGPGAEARCGRSREVLWHFWAKRLLARAGGSPPPYCAAQAKASRPADSGMKIGRAPWWERVCQYVVI